MPGKPIERYFDNAATTPVDPRVLKEMLPFLQDDFGNANSIHSFGLKAHAAVNLARERVATLIGAEDPSQVIFTSGATEANNWVIRAFESGCVSPFEHSSVREPALHAGMVELVNDLDHDAFALFPPKEKVGLISIMSVNNEIGVTFKPTDFKDYGRAVHSDMTQQLGKTTVSLEGIDYASFSAHKLYGPKGVGALYFADGPPEPYLRGGEQENGLRAGTLNVPGIVGFGAACAIALDEQEKDFKHAQKLRSIVLEGLKGDPPFELDELKAWRETGTWEGLNHGDRSVVPHILSLSCWEIEGETLVIEADAAGYAISAGAACSSRSTEPSHVLTALGLEPEWLRGTIRISFGRFNTAEAARDLAKTLKHSIQKLRRMS